MKDNNVIEHDTALWVAGDKAVEQIELHTAGLMGAWVDFGTAVSELRSRHPVNQQFGSQCEDRWPGISRQWRFAAMWWAGLSNDDREALSDAYPTSLVPKSLLNKCHEHHPELVKKIDVPSGNIDQVISETTEKAPVEPDSKKTATTERVNIKPKNVQHATTPNNTNNHEFILAKNYLLYQYPFDENNIRKAKNAACKKSLRLHCDWKALFIRLSQLIESVSSEPYQKKFGKDFGPHCIWVNFPKNAHLYGKMKGVISKKLVTEILDNWNKLDELNHACSSENDYSSTFMNNWWKNNVTEINKISAEKEKTSIVSMESVMKNLTTDSEKSPLIEKKLAEPEHEGEIIVHGTRIWPCEDFCKYSFEEAWAAYHFWEDADRMMKVVQADAETRGRNFMELKRYLEYASPTFADAFWKIASAEALYPNCSETRAPRLRDRFK